MVVQSIDSRMIEAGVSCGMMLCQIQGSCPAKSFDQSVLHATITQTHIFTGRCTFGSVIMALIQSTLIWVVYAIVLVLVIAISSIFVYVYQAPKERSATVTIVCIFTLTSLLATVLLLPVDVALVSSTTSSRHGRRKDWATQDQVDSILLTLKIVYYTLYSLDAVLCLIVVPFTYFWQEEYDEVEAEEGNQTFGSRFWGAFKYTTAFILLAIIMFLVGFFVPVAKDREGAHYDLDFFKQLLRGENREYLQSLQSNTMLTTLTVRWRTCAHVFSRPPRHHWNVDLRALHFCRLRPVANHSYQICSKNICAHPQRQHSFRA